MKRVSGCFLLLGQPENGLAGWLAGLALCLMLGQWGVGVCRVGNLLVVFVIGLWFVWATSCPPYFALLIAIRQPENSIWAFRLPMLPCNTR